MNEFKGYRNGVDLGGWLSQCGYEKEHIESFITEADIARIASWGCDHVRLPFDYNIILDDSGNVLESGLKLLERCADWCVVHGLNIILDLHKRRWDFRSTRASRNPGSLRISAIRIFS